VLYVNKFRVAGLMDKPINAYFEALFETGVDEVGREGGREEKPMLHLICLWAHLCG